MKCTFCNEAFRHFFDELSNVYFQVFTLGSNAQTLLGRGSHGGFFEAKFANGLGVIMGVCVAGQIHVESGFI